MDGAAAPASIAISISIGTSLLMGFFGLWVAIRRSKGAAVNRDKEVSILFGIAALLTLLFVIASALIGVFGMSHVGPLKAALLLTAAFAAVGIVLGLVRAVRRGRAIQTESA